MKGINLIDSVSFGYQAVWLEQRYLLKLALVPILIKIACATISEFAGHGDFYLRQALISLPAALAEGWLIAQFLRTLLLMERWPIYLEQNPTEGKMAALLLRARGIMSSTIMFTLIAFLGYGIKGVWLHMYDLSPAAGTSPPAEPGEMNLLAFPFLIGCFFFFIFFFRLLWLHIPLVVLMPIRTFLKMTDGIGNSIRLIGICLVCMLPCGFAVMIVIKIVTALVGGGDPAKFLSLILALIADTVINLITTAAIAYGLREILPRHPQSLPEIEKA